MSRSPTWVCSRQSGGKKCGTDNPNIKRLCVACGKPRPPRRKPAHMRALTDYTYADYVEMFGEVCGICGRAPSEGKKLRRDHPHYGEAAPRGLLCWRHNLALQSFGDHPELLRAAADYLERAQGEN